jgi:hypothetical protein
MVHQPIGERKPVAICTFLALLWISRRLVSHYDFWLMLKKQTGWHDGTIP